MDRHDRARILGLWAVLAATAIQAITPDGNSLTSSWLLRFVTLDLLAVGVRYFESKPIEAPDRARDAAEVCALPVASKNLRARWDSERLFRIGWVTGWSGQCFISPSNSYRIGRDMFTEVESDGHIRDRLRLQC